MTSPTDAPSPSVVPVTRQEYEAGLYGKFRVERVDGRDKPGGDKANSRYFVLDYANDDHAQIALLKYADSVGVFEPALARDLYAAVEAAREANPERRP